MSFEINAKIICDGCGISQSAQPEHRVTQMSSVIVEAKVKATNAGWTSVPRGPYLPKAHYCAKCADKPQKPIPKKKAPVRERGLYDHTF